MLTVKEYSQLVVSHRVHSSSLVASSSNFLRQMTQLADLRNNHIIVDIDIQGQGSLG